MQEEDSKPKFYQPDNRELLEEKNSQIMSRIHDQEKSILNLLEKYKDLLPDPSILQTEQKPTASKEKNVSASHKQQIGDRRRSLPLNPQSRTHNLKLPVIVESQKGKKSSRVSGPRNQHLKKKKQMTKDLSRVYRGQSHTISIPEVYSKNVKSKFAERRERAEKTLAEKNQLKETSNIFDDSRLSIKQGEYVGEEMGLLDLDMAERQIMKPISYKKPQQSQIQKKDSDSDKEAEVPLKFYEREWQKLFEEQCKEEMNFLYFSTTTEMKEWSQQIVQLFQKHDEAEQKLHKRDKFLQKFDENYFLADLYKVKK